MASLPPGFDRPDPAPVLLAIGGDGLFGHEISSALKGAPDRLFVAGDLDGGLKEIGAQQPDAVLLDPVADPSGHDALQRIKQIAPGMPVIVVAADGSGQRVIEAIKHSAFDYVLRPVDPSKLRPRIDRAVAWKRALAAGVASKTSETALVVSGSEPALVGGGLAMQSVYQGIGRGAPLDIPVLIRGEHGTGGAGVAREVHRRSGRSAGPLVEINCRGDEARWLEEKLFGRPNTAGREGSLGKAREAAKGTLVLQEIDAMPLSLQAELILALREGSYEAGTGERVPFTCRLVAITTADLEARVRAGEFRADLFYALSSCVLNLPALRQRPADLPSLVACLLEKMRPISAAYGFEQPCVSAAVMRVLRSHLWPGNLDELESVLRRALVEQRGHLVVADDLLQALSGDPVVTARGSSASTTDWDAFAEIRFEAGSDAIHAEAIVETERKLFARVLRHTRGNQAQAARLLGITRASLRKKLRLYGMVAKQAGGSDAG